MLLKLIEDLCTGTSARVRLGQKLSPRFMTFSSVYAKVASSHLLYFVPPLTSLWTVSQSCGISVGNAWFSDLDYADDVVLFAERQILASALQSMEEESSMFGLHISWSKTEVQNLGAGPDAQDLVVNGHTVDGVSEFIYLGSKQSSRANSPAECVRRIALAAGVTNDLNDVCRQRSLSLHTKFRLYSA